MKKLKYLTKNKVNKLTNMKRNHKIILRLLLLAYIQGFIK